MLEQRDNWAEPQRYAGLRQDGVYPCTKHTHTFIHTLTSYTHTLTIYKITHSTYNSDHPDLPNIYTQTHSTCKLIPHSHHVYLHITQYIYKCHTYMPHTTQSHIPHSHHIFTQHTLSTEQSRKHKGMPCEPSSSAHHPGQLQTWQEKTDGYMGIWSQGTPLRHRDNEVGDPEVETQGGVRQQLQGPLLSLRSLQGKPQHPPAEKQAAVWPLGGQRGHHPALWTQLHDRWRGGSQSQARGETANNNL